MNNSKENTYKRLNNWANEKLSWLILVGIIIFIATVIISNVSRDYLEVEGEKGNDFIIGESIKQHDIITS